MMEQESILRWLTVTSHLLICHVLSVFIVLFSPTLWNLHSCPDLEYENLENILMGFQSLKDCFCSRCHLPAWSKESSPHPSEVFFFFDVLKPAKDFTWELVIKL